MRTGFFPFFRALDEIIDILREGGSFVSGQLQGVRSYAGACASVVTIPEGLQPRRSCGAKKNSIRFLVLLIAGFYSKGMFIVGSSNSSLLLVY